MAQSTGSPISNGAYNVLTALQSKLIPQPSAAAWPVEEASALPGWWRPRILRGHSKQAVRWKLRAESRKLTASRREARMENRIAFVDDRGDLYTADAAGQDRRPVVPGPRGGPRAGAVSATNWPAWSPDGRAIAFSWVSRSRVGLTIRLLVADTTSGEVTEIYENPPDVPPGIAPNLPHFILWSPDSRRLAFLTMTAAGQTLFVATADGSGSVRPIATGAPFFPVWSPDGRRLLFHLEADLYLLEDGDPDSAARPHPIGAASTSYRVPAWSPDGGRLAFVEDTRDGPELIVSDAAGEDRRRLGGVSPGVAVIWSPAGEALALAQPLAPGDAYHGLEILDPAGGDRRRLASDDLLSFVWSPDGREIAFAGVDLDQSTMYWSIVGADGANRRRLAAFVPSRDALTALTFFDQYAHAVRWWSPDSRSLVFAGRLAHPVRGNGHQGSEAHQDQVYLLDTQGETPPRVAGRGTLGFWTWR